MDLFEFLKHHWVLLSFLAPMFWALVNVIDVYFVGEIYRDELDGTIITGLFQIIPFAIISSLFLKISLSSFVTFSPSSGLLVVDPILLFAILGGFLFTSSFYFYFKALFKQNDVAFLQIIWGLTIIAVPVLAFLFWGEQLSSGKYAGMLLTLVGATLLSFNKKLRNKFSWRYILVMLSAVITLSLSMVLEGKAYQDLFARGLGDQGFLLGFLCFSLGAVIAGFTFLIAGKRNPFPLIKKYGLIFLLLEGVSFLGNLTSQRAISVAPSVSFVATIETFVPVFIVIYSLFILSYFSINRLKKTNIVERIYKEQIDGIWMKVIATVIMGIGVFIIST